MSFIDKKNRLFSLGQNRDGKTGLGKTIFSQKKKSVTLLPDSDEDESIVTDPISRQIFRKKRLTEQVALGPDESVCLCIPIMVS